MNDDIHDVENDDLHDLNNDVLRVPNNQGVFRQVLHLLIHFKDKF